MTECTTWCTARSNTTQSTDELSQLDDWEVLVTGFSKTVKDAIQAHVWGAGAQSYSDPPTEYWVALCTSSSADDNAGTEVTDVDYSRQQVTLEVDDNDSSGWISSGNLDFAGVDEGTAIYSVNIYSQETDGTFLAYGNLVAPVTITTNRMFHIDSGNLKLRFND